MTLHLFNNLKERDKSESIKDLIADSSPRQDFFLMVILSVLMASFGLLIDDTAVIIGSMLVAPILSPVLSLSLGIVIADYRLISRSFYTILKSVIFGIISATLVTWLFNFNSNYHETASIIARTKPSLIYASIAFVAGLAASFARIKPQLSETLPGVAISVALIPPIAVTGIGMAHLDWNVISGSFLLFFLNTMGIVFASMIVFSLMNLYVKKKIIDRAIKKEEAALEAEKNK